MYCPNAITVDIQGFLTVDEFDQVVKNRAKEERCGYIEAALLTAWDYMASLGRTVKDPLTEAHKICMRAVIAKWTEISEDRWSLGMYKLMDKFREWGYRYGG
jgi:hypothetical protein